MILVQVDCPLRNSFWGWRFQGQPVCLDQLFNLGHVFQVNLDHPSYFYLSILPTFFLGILRGRICPSCEIWSNLFSFVCVCTCLGFCISLVVFNFLNKLFVFFKNAFVITICKALYSEFWVDRRSPYPHGAYLHFSIEYNVEMEDH